MPNLMNLGTMTFPAAASSGIVARRVVVMDGTNKGDVKLPAATPEKTVVGVTIEKISAANNVDVQMFGVAMVESDGTAVINPGDYVICGGGADGRVKTQAIAAGSVNLYDVIGMCVDDGQIPATAGAYVSVLLGKRPVVAA